MRLRQVSSGERTKVGQIRIVQSAATLKKVVSGFDLKRANYVWKEDHKISTYALKATVKKKGLRTILLDEPGRSLDIPAQEDLWRGLSQQKKFQLIVATHSVFALNVEGAQYVDIRRGYLTKCRKALASIAR